MPGIDRPTTVLPAPASSRAAACPERASPTTRNGPAGSGGRISLAAALLIADRFGPRPARAPGSARQLPIDCWYSVKPMPEQTAAMIQKRSMIFVSDQAIISKWWCSGAISRTRRRKVLKEKTWIATESASITKMPPMMISSTSVWVITASAPIAPPKPERAGVAHEDRGREGVEPEEADAGADQAGGEQGQVLLPVGDEGDRRVGEQDDRAGAGGEAVEAVGQVDAVGGAGDDEEDEHEVEDRAEVELASPMRK